MNRVRSRTTRILDDVRKEDLGEAERRRAANPLGQRTVLYN